MIGVDVRILESLNTFTPLGLRFWDDVEDRQIRDALRVRIWPEPRPQLAREAYRTLSDVYAFRRIPGLWDVETRDPAGEESPPAARPYVVEVADRRRRFLPVSFVVDLPLASRGVYLAGSEVSPIEPSARGFVLLSAPTRPVQAALAVLRADLVIADTGEPAAHALLRLRIDDEPPWFGLADAGGRAALFFPWPTLVDELGGSPGNGSSEPLSGRTWPVAVDVFHEPGEQAALNGASVPDYLSLLHQAPAGVYVEPPDEDGEPVAGWTGELQFDTELIVSTRGRSQLLVSPA